MSFIATKHHKKQDGKRTDATQSQYGAKPCPLSRKWFRGIMGQRVANTTGIQ